MRLISSRLALEAVAALAATDQLGLTGLAGALEASTSAVQRALGLLVDDGIVERIGGGRPAYRVSRSERTTTVATLALGEMSLSRALAIGARANLSVELVARASDGLVVVFAAGSSASGQARAAAFIERLAAREGLPVTYRDHDDVRRDLLAGPELRRSMARAEILVGDIDRTFPDRSRHFRPPGRRLGRPHRSLRRPSHAFVARLAREHGLASLKLFGSAVRSDLRPDSDVDVLVRYRRDVRPSLHSMMALERTLETAFGRDVDLVREETLRPEARERVDREAVSLL